MDLCKRACVRGRSVRPCVFTSMSRYALKASTSSKLGESGNSPMKSRSSHLVPLKAVAHVRTTNHFALPTPPWEVHPSADTGGACMNGVHGIYACVPCMYLPHTRERLRVLLAPLQRLCTKTHVPAAGCVRCSNVKAAERAPRLLPRTAWSNGKDENYKKKMRRDSRLVFFSQARHFSAPRRH